MPVVREWGGIKRWCAACLASASTATLGLAGQNANGTLLLHVNPDVVYSAGDTVCDRHAAFDCATVNPSATGPDPVYVWAIAAFSPTIAVRLKGVVFGLEYDADHLVILETGPCAEFALPTSNWPAPGSGTSLAWDEVRTEHFTPVCWFAAYNAQYPIPSALAVTTHPTQGGYFADDSVPSELDPIADFGRCGFEQPGYVPCPTDPANVGACCFDTGQCVLRREQDCNGYYLGNDTNCIPNPCPAILGACCLGDGSCVQRFPQSCDSAGGQFLGYGVPCDPLPCPPVGACCRPDGGCRVLTADACVGQGDRWFGQFADCSTSPCADLPGACCFGGSCRIRSADQCEDEGGIFIGTDQQCVVNLCGVNPCGATFATGVRGNEPARLEAGSGVVATGTELEGCGYRLLHSDGSYEYAYAWQYNGVTPPYYGAFAECYTAQYPEVCAIFLDLTTIFLDSNFSDLYVWEDDAGCPGAVACVRVGVMPTGVAFWPNTSRHGFEIAPCCVGSRFWVGYWGNWPGGYAAYYVGADLDGPAGCPVTHIAPGIGYPSGWQSASVVWGPTRSLGIGCELRSCPPVAVQRMSWGRVKALYGK